MKESSANSTIVSVFNNGVLKEIEVVREDLNELYDIKGEFDDEVILLSEKLDTLLNEYMDLIK